MMMFSILFTVISALAQSESTTVAPTATTPAQAPATPASTEGVETKQMQKITVTGSYIKRVDEEGPSPIKTVGKEQLEKSGANSVADAMRDSAITTGASRESSLAGAANAGASTVSLRGFNSGDILVLLNGQRLPKIGGGNSVDVNMIPPSALERVEILKDGASALYGSDAVGGVINYITKKNYDGASANIRYSMPVEKGGTRLDASGTFGKTYSKGSILGVVHYRNNERLYDRDRKFSKISDLTKQGSPIGSPGSWFNNGVATAGGGNDPCPAGNLQPLAGGQVCAFDSTKYSAFLPDIQQLSTMLSGEVKIYNSLKFKMDAIYTRREVKSILAPGPDQMILTQAQATSLGLPAPAGNSRVLYRTVEELGQRLSDNINNSYIAQPSVEFKIGKWDMDISSAYGLSKTRSDSKQGYGRREAMMALLGPGPGQWNPFAAPGSKGSLASAAYQPWQEITTTQTSAKVIATGPLHQGNSVIGPIAMAVGASAERQSYREETDPLAGQRGTDGLTLVYGGGSGANGAGDRNFQSAFTEFNYFPIDSIETGIALRYDNFSDFGDTFNPKLSLSWQATDTLLLRSSVGTGFKAPNLSNLYSGPSGGAQTFVDKKACAAGIAGTCAPRQWTVRSAGNKNLREETSIFYSAGLVAQPKKNWNITLDGFYVSIKDRVGLNYAYITEAERQGINLPSYGINVSRLANGTIEFIDAPILNLGSEKKAGIDFTISNETKTSLFGQGFTIQTTFDHQHVIYSNEIPFPGVGNVKQFDLNWRNVVTIGLSMSHHRLRLLAKTFPGGDKESNNGAIGAVGFGSTYKYTEYDADYTYANLFGGELTFGVRNLFNTKRPLDDSQTTPYDSLNERYFDPVGQSFYLGYNYNF